MMVMLTTAASALASLKYASPLSIELPIAVWHTRQTATGVDESAFEPGTFYLWADQHGLHLLAESPLVSTQVDYATPESFLEDYRTDYLHDEVVVWVSAPVIYHLSQLPYLANKVVTDQINSNHKLGVNSYLASRN